MSSLAGSKASLGTPLLVPVTESSQVGEARRQAAAMARNLGFDETREGKVALVVTELANNLARHATRGELIVQPVRETGREGIEILSIDQGPGMTNVAECLQDGFSTGGTRGAGLGAIRRLSDDFDLHSQPGVGTVVGARLYLSAPVTPSGKSLEFGVVSLPLSGEEVCGDAWAVERQDGRTLLCVVDGLGHGQIAAGAAREAIRIFRAQAHRTPPEILDAAHPALRSTRGAAMAIAEVRPGDQEVRFAGVGNVAGVIVAPAGSSHLVSHNGTVGLQMRPAHQFTYRWPEGALLVMHTDGLRSQWRLDQYPGLGARSASVIAGVLYRDFRRTRDDVTVVVAREAAAV